MPARGGCRALGSRPDVRGSPQTMALHPHADERSQHQLIEVPLPSNPGNPCTTSSAWLAPCRRRPALRIKGVASSHTYVLACTSPTAVAIVDLALSSV